VPGLVALGLAALLWASTSGPVDVIGPSTLKQAPPRALPSATASASSPPAREPIREYMHPRSHSLAWLGDLIAWAFFLAVATALVLGLVWLWRHRWHRPPAPPTIDVDALPDVAALTEALRRDVGGQLAELEQGTPGDGIVRCWLRFEQVVADAGLPRDASDTSSELTVRVLHALDLDPRAVGALAALYREARFSRHHLDEGARTAARSLLQQLHSELAELGGTPREAGRR
jgi:hypothetical protein